MKNHACIICGQDFLTVNSAPGKYCSIACKAEAQRRAKPVTVEWLREQYVVNKLSCTDISHMVHRNSKRVWEWLRNAGIPTRKRGEVDNGHRCKAGMPSAFKGHRHTDATRRRLREIAIADGRVPFDRAIGPCFKGKRGADIPSWRGGVTTERQRFNSSPNWKAATTAVFKRDDATCQRCGHHNGGQNRQMMAVHHKRAFAHVETRVALDNLVLLCQRCHRWVHSKQNTERRFIV